MAELVGSVRVEAWRQRQQRQPRDEGEQDHSQNRQAGPPGKAPASVFKSAAPVWNANPPTIHTPGCRNQKHDLQRVHAGAEGNAQRDQRLSQEVGHTEVEDRQVRAAGLPGRRPEKTLGD